MAFILMLPGCAMVYGAWPGELGGARRFAGELQACLVALHQDRKRVWAHTPDKARQAMLGVLSLECSQGALNAFAQACHEGHIPEEQFCDMLKVLQTP